MCGLLSPPRSPCLLSPPRRTEVKPTTHPPVPRQRTRHASEMSNSEMAAFLEKETLRDAEENDYLLMQDLIQHRIHRDAPVNNVYFLFEKICARLGNTSEQIRIGYSTKLQKNDILIISITSRLITPTVNAELRWKNFAVTCMRDIIDASRGCGAIYGISGK